MDRFSYQTKGVCSKKIDIEIEDNIILRVTYHGGCSGNTQGVAALVKGRNVDEVIEIVKGIKCGPRSTSCPDQLSKALTELKEQ